MRVPRASSFPKGTRLWDIDGIPVAEVRDQDGGSSIRAFGGAPLVSSVDAALREGTPLNPEDWDRRFCQTSEV
jgi:hypothetical protein